MKKILLLFVFLSAIALGQITTTGTGNWSSTTPDAPWPSGIVPTSADNVIIAHAVVVDDAFAVCNDLSFTTGSISFGSASSVLSVYGNSTFGAGITSITSWTAGAKLVFTGTATQTWTTGTTSRFDIVEVNKSSGTVTQATGAIVRIGTSFTVTGGGIFTLPSGNDIEGVQFADGSTATTPTITVGVGSTFNCDVASTAVIRSGTTGTASIGAVTVYGTMNLASTSGNGFRFGAVTVGNGTDAASLNMTTNFGASAVYTFASLAVNANASFNMNATTLTASTITGDITGTGTVVYGTSASTNHPGLDRGFGGNVTFNGATRSVTTTAPRTISGNLSIGAGTLTITASTTNTFTVNGNVTVSGTTGKILMGGGDLIINGNLTVSSTGTTASPSLYFSSTAARVMGGASSTGTGTFAVQTGSVVRSIYSATSSTAATQSPISTQFPYWQTLDLQSGSTWSQAIPSGATGIRYADIQDSYNGSPISYRNLSIYYVGNNATNTGCTWNCTITNPSVASSFTAEIVPSTAVAGQTNTLNVTLSNPSSLTLPSMTLQQSTTANITANTNVILGSQPVNITGNVSITNINATATGTSTVVTVNAGALTIGGTLTLGSTTASTTFNNPYILLNDPASTLTVTGAATLRSSQQTNGNIKYTNAAQTVTFNGSCATANGNATSETFSFNNVNGTLNFNDNFSDGATGTTFFVSGTEVPVINFNNGTSGSPKTTSSAGLRGAVTVNGYRQTTGTNFRTNNATTSAYSLTVAGTLDLVANGSTATNSGGGTNTLNGSGTIKLTGDYATKITGYSANNFQGTGTLHLAGSTTQTIPAGTYGGITVENSSGATLGGAASITGTLTLTTGNLTLGANNLTLASAVAGTPSASKHIVTDGAGKVVKNIATSGTFTYPVGYDGSTYNPVTVALDGASTADDFSVKVASGISPAAENNATAVAATWDISEAVATGSNATLTFQWTAAQEGGSFTRGGAAAWHHNGSNWVNVSGGSTTGSDPYTMSTTGTVSSFSPFIVGNDGALPVELASFTASAKGKNVELKWNTATELNNHGFEVERSMNGEWSKVAFVEGAGTSNSTKQYGYTDAVAANGKYSYRLKQIDNNGSFRYSSAVEANVIVVPDAYTITQNYPNPFNPSTRINFTVKAMERATMKVYDITGREVATLFNDVAQPGQLYTVQFNASQFASGVYFYVLSTPNFREVKKMSLLK